MNLETQPIEATESDVEQKLLIPLIKDILGYADLEIKSQEYLVPTDIDKGAGKRIGYYPDYVIYVAGLPVLIIEAKDPETECKVGYREARLYATEINKNFPEGINPASRILCTNGVEIMFSSWDSEADSIVLNVDDLMEGTSALALLKSQLSRASLVHTAQEIRLQTTPPASYKPLNMIGGPARQNETITPNTFSAQLAPLLRKYFDPDETTHSPEVIERGYCSSEEVTKYNSTLESLLKDRIPGQDSFAHVKTTRNKAPTIDSAIQGAMKGSGDVPDPLILLVGSVGAGKSMFIQRYLRHLIPTEIAENSVWVQVNFNEAPSNLTYVESWICEQFNRSYTKMYPENDALSFDNLNRYFSPDIKSRRTGVYKLLYENDRAEYERRITNDLQVWTDDPAKLASGIIRYHSKDRGVPVVVVFDNVDRRDRDQQLAAFQAVQWFRHRNTCFSLLALRDETFDAYRDEPPLDAYLKPFAFRISAPRFVTVVRKRLELALEHLSKNAERTQSFTLTSGVTIRYPSSNVGRYLMKIYTSIFNPKRSVRLILEALSGRNVRHALEMFTEILMSGYLSDERLFSISEGSNRGLPEWLIIRVLMRTNFRYYAEKHGYIANLYDSPDSSNSANNFLLTSLLEFLAKNRKVKTGFKLEGFFYVTDLIQEFSTYGYSLEDLMWALERCLNAGLIIADHQRDSGISQQDYVRVSAAGYFHLRFLSKRSEYLANVIFDTRMSDRDKASQITQFDTDSRQHTEKRLIILREYLDNERNRYGEIYSRYLTSNDPSYFQIENITETINYTNKINKTES